MVRPRQPDLTPQYGAGVLLGGLQQLQIRRQIGKLVAGQSVLLDPQYFTGSSGLQVGRGNLETVGGCFQNPQAPAYGFSGVLDEHQEI